MLRPSPRRYYRRKMTRLAERCACLLVLTWLVYQVQGGSVLTVERWTDCGLTAQAPFVIESVEPNWDQGYFAVRGLLQRRVTNGESIVSVYRGVVHLSTVATPLCELVTCPAEATYSALRLSFDMPAAIPSGRYHVEYRAEDENKALVACATLRLVAE